MSLYIAENIPESMKILPPHPWEGVIKKSLANRIKHAHNSVSNPLYPPCKKKRDIAVTHERVHISIVGDQVTKEFIYCVNLVRGLHKYRSKIFDVPVIRGVTTVEWPNVLNDLKIRYGGLAFCLESSVAVIVDDKFIGGEKELREVIEAKFNYHVDLDYYKEGVNNFARFLRSSGRSTAYMHILIDGEHVGTLIFMLYSDVVPYTCENFLRLCVQKRGGYSGTPVHRIVKDCWIQCGGFGLKSTDLDCENYIVPHDRRGVLGMANDGRNVDCSTQFFVLLQPAPWMAKKYVAFGQLIDGESTLRRIESVKTFYEAPLQNIIIHTAGILNMECQDIIINKMTKEYIHGHIEDLIDLGESLYAELMDRVSLEIINRIMHRMEEAEMAEEEIMGETNSKANIRAAQRFIRKKEDIEKADNNQDTDRKASSVQSEPQQENNDFDVEVYEYEHEPEEDSYKRLPMSESVSIVVKPEKPFYIPLTDVPYPGEKDSTFDIKNFLKGDFCLESDLQTMRPQKICGLRESFLSAKESPDTTSIQSLDSDDEKEIKTYLKMNSDRVSFAGNVIKTIARASAKINIFEDFLKSDLITDEELRRFRLASVAVKIKDQHDKKVSISIPSGRQEPQRIKRRQTGFVRNEDLEKILSLHNLPSQDIHPPEDEELSTERKVRIAPTSFKSHTTTNPKISRRQTGFEKIRAGSSDLDVRRQSALTRLYEDVTETYDQGPTLKDYRPKSEIPKNMLLTYSPESARMKSDEDTRGKHLRRSVVLSRSFEQGLNTQPSKKAGHKISSDYVKTIDQGTRNLENSIRSVEYAKTRPSMSVNEYQQKNQHNLTESKLALKLKKPRQSLHGIRLPGDTPLYSMTDIANRKR